MLSVLNEMIKNEDQRIICQSLNKKEIKTVSMLKSDLSILKSRVESVDAKEWFLHVQDPYLFLMGMLCLLGLKKKVILSANAQPQWLADISNDFSAALTDVKDLKVADTKIINIKNDANTSVENDDEWLPHFNGKEQLVFYTSGSSGLAKKIPKTFIALTNEIETLNSAFGSQLSNSTFVATVSHHHIYGLLFFLLLPFLSKNIWANEIVEYPEQVVSLKSSFKNISIVSSPAFLSRLDMKLSGIFAKVVFSSGGPLSFASAQSALEVYQQLPIEVFGSTETGGIAYRQQQRGNSAWQLFKGISVEEDEEGCSIQSPHIPERQSTRLDDILEFQDDGRFMLKGRRDRVVNIEEKRVSLQEIERFLMSLDGIEQAVVLVVEGKRTILGSVLTLTDLGKRELTALGSNQYITNIKKSMRKRFEAITIPKKWRVVDEMPINTQSKIDNQALLSLFQKSLD